MSEILQRAWRRAEWHFRPLSWLRKAWWTGRGARFGPKTGVPPLRMTWPHQVSVGASCLLDDGIFFNYDGSWQPGPSIIVEDRVFIGQGCEFNIRVGLRIGSDGLIASGCKFIDHDHAMAREGGPMNRQLSVDIPIVLEEDVWLGVNVVVLKGVTIGRGAVVGAGAVVTKSIPAFEIWGGIPARKISARSVGQGMRLENDTLSS